MPGFSNDPFGINAIARRAGAVKDVPLSSPTFSGSGAVKDAQLSSPTFSGAGLSFQQVGEVPVEQVQPTIANLNMQGPLPSAAPVQAPVPAPVRSPAAAAKPITAPAPKTPGLTEVGGGFYDPAYADQIAKMTGGLGTQQMSDPGQPASGVYSAKGMKEFYANDFENKRKFAQTLQARAEQAAETLTKQAPDYEKTYSEDYMKNVQPYEQQFSDKYAEALRLKQQMDELEDNLRKESGGAAPDWYIKSEAATRNKDLVSQHRALLDEMSAIETKRGAALGFLKDRLGYQKDTRTDEMSQAKEIMSQADTAFDNVTTALTNGRAIQKEDSDRIETALLNNPDLLRVMTEEEFEAFKATGAISLRAIKAMGNTVKEEANAIAATKAGEKPITWKDVSDEVHRMVSEDAGWELKPPEEVNAEATRRLRARNTLAQGGTTPTAGAGQRKVVGGYDITDHATDPQHEAKVESILNGIGKFNTVEDIDQYIEEKFPDSPISGDMVKKASDKYGVSWEMLVAMMEQDSSLGTKGKAVRTKNPGNVGNDDAGNTVTHKTWQDGVNAEAEWLSRNKVGDDKFSDDTAEVVGQGFINAAPGLGMSRQERVAKAKKAKEMWLKGNVEGVKNSVDTGITNKESKEADIFNAADTRLTTMKSTLNQLDRYVAMGGDVNKLVGTQEQVMNALGAYSKNPELSKLASKMMGDFFAWRKSNTGAVFTNQENNAYMNISPSIDKTVGFNRALLQQAIDSSEEYKNMVRQRAIGSEAYKTIWGEEEKAKQADLSGLDWKM